MDNFDCQKVEKIIHYRFKDKSLLKKAFTHSSFANQYNTESNERLEFLGDSILNFVVAEALFLKYHDEEGKMSKERSRMVSSSCLTSIIESINLDKYLLLGSSMVGLDNIPSSVKENLFECIVAAIYLDSSLDKAKRFIFRFIDVDAFVSQKDNDYKTKLQEVVQSVHGAELVYVTYERPAGSGNFCAKLYINDILVATATSISKKKAQMECAKQALKNKKLKEIIEKSN